MSTDTYKEVKKLSFGSYKDKGSKFISYCYPVYSEEEIKDKIEEIKKKEHAAKHYCYAYILNTDKSLKRTNDDGEPSSTAGKPILGQILSSDLTNILIIVTRYFGGVKLGVGGLINAYRKAAADAISKSVIITKVIQERYEVSFQYIQMNDVMRIVKEYKLDIIDTDFSINCKLIFAVAKSKRNTTLNAFKKNHNLKIQYIKK